MKIYIICKFKFTNYVKNSDYLLPAGPKTKSLPALQEGFFIP